MKKHSYLYFVVLILALYSYCGNNAWNPHFFQNIGFKESNYMAVKKNTKSQSNDKLWWKVMSCSYHIE